jgi:transcriptional regulator with XRE-family HTH domain
MNFLGKNLRYLRKKSARRQEDIGALVNKGQTTIGNWEKGISQPNIEEILLLSDYFAIPVDVLLKDDLAATDDPGDGQADKKEHPGVKYEPGKEETMAREKESLTYALNEIRSMREEIEHIKERLGPAEEE